MNAFHKNIKKKDCHNLLGEEPEENFE